MLVLAIVEGVMICMSVGSIGALTLPVFVLGVVTITTALYGFWGVQKEDTTKLTIIGWSFFWIALSVVAATVGRLYLANKYCDAADCSSEDDQVYEDEFGDTYSCEERAENEKNSCIHAHYVNAILVCATSFPTSAFLALIVYSLILKHQRGETIPEGALSDALEDDLTSVRNQPLQGMQSAETSVMGRPVVAGKQLWALPFFKTKLRPPPADSHNKQAPSLPNKDSKV